MIRLLIVDDERLEREGVKYLLSQEKKEWRIYEAANGKDALQILREEKIDLLLTDIKMPHMDGLELTSKAKELYPELPVVIFSGYSDFAFAQEAMRYGVTEYVLKPVDPEEFHKIIQKTESMISDRKEKQKQEQQEQDFLQQYFLENYLYSGNKDILEKAGNMIDITHWEEWRCAIMIEADVSFFDRVENDFQELLQKEVRRAFYYSNLNSRQSILFFKDIYCDYQLVANLIYTFLKRNYRDRFYLAVSRMFEGVCCLPEIMSQLEQQMEEKFYHPEKHIFANEEEHLKMAMGEVQDSHLMQMISEDISRKDTELLRKHFRTLKEKYTDNTKYSAMYIKFVFSNLIQELFQEDRFSGERRLEKEIDRLYNCRNIIEILKVTEENICEYEKFLERSMSESRNEVAVVKNYIYQHYDEDLNLETLAEKVYLSSGYLSFIFKKETGMNLNRYIRVFRMEKAGELLKNTNMKVAQVSEKVGFSNVSYFCRSFREFYGKSPESYRKGNTENEESVSED